MFRNLALLGKLYVRPIEAMSNIIDEGSWLFAVAAVLAVSLLLHLPDHAGTRSIPAAVTVAVPADAGNPPEGEHLGRLAASAVQVAFMASPSGLFTAALLLAIVHVPVAILCVVCWDSLGACGTVLRRDYTPLLACFGMAWAAAYLPLALFKLVQPLDAWIWILGGALYCGLAACGLRTLFGTHLLKAVPAALTASAAGAAAFMLYQLSGGYLSYFASPFLLFYLIYYGFRHFEGDFRLIGAGLRNRQSYRRHLEICAINPRDSDAHYQLGLILRQRRQYAQARARFERCVEIDPQEPEAHFQLGMIARDEGRAEQALDHFRRAAAADDRHAASEVWREIGALQFAASRLPEARRALEKFVERRPYDPEGLYWLGRTLAALGEQAGAREHLERSAEAVRTAPGFRRRNVKRWGELASGELRTLR